MKLSKLPKEVKSYYYISSVVYTLLRVLAMTSPLLMKVIVDDAIPSQDFNSVILWIILFCSIPIATTLVDVLYFRWINGVIWNNSLKVNHRVFTNMIDQPLSYFSEKDTGELINLYKSDVTQLYSYYLIERPKLVSQGIVALLVLFSLYALSPTIALIQLILIPLIIFPTRGIFNKISIISSELFKNNGQRIGLVTECLRNIKSVKVNLFSSFYTARLLNYHKDLVEIWKKIFTFDILATAWGNSFIGPFNLAVSFIFAVSAVVNGNMTLGSLILVISYTPVFCNFLVTYASTNIQLANKNEEFTKVLQLSAAESPLSQGAKTEIKAIDSIAFEEVGFSYNENDLLKGMNFNLKKEMFFISKVRTVLANQHFLTF